MKKINHIGVAVYSLDDSVEIFKKVLNINPSKKETVESEGVETIFFNLGNTKIELMQPFGSDSPIEKFLLKNNSGGIHHICLEVDDIFKTRDHLLKNNISIIGDKEPKIGAHNKPVLFLHPKDFFGTLIELEQE